MYRITCDGYPIYDPRDDAFIVEQPKITLADNATGEGSFIIHKNHPYYGNMKLMKSVFEVSDDIGVIFRGRMTANSCEFHNSKFVDMEGMMACFNDTIVRPYAFPADFLGDAGYIAAADSGNVVEFFLGWLIAQHNNQVTEAQRFKLGRVTVTDPNNTITRSDANYPSTWEVLKNKLFGSKLGGYLCIRYEDDGNYIDYLADYELTNTQVIEYGKNLLDLTTDVDASQTYSAAIPVGATSESEVATIDDEGSATTQKITLTIADLPDGEITDDIVKQGDMIYSKKAVEAFGFVLAPIKETTWNDVTMASNLLQKCVEFLAGDGVMLTETIEVKAADQHFTDAQVQSFRIYRKVIVNSIPHGHSGTYLLSRLELDLAAPQNTNITVGASRRTLTDINSDKESDTTQRIESALKDIEENRTQTGIVKEMVVSQSTELVNTCTEIYMRALEDYVATSDLEKFKSTLTAELSVLASRIEGRVSKAEETIQNVDGDLQAKFNKIVKYFTFDIDGLTIGEVNNQHKIVIDNDDITIYAKGIPVQTFRADGTSTIPMLTVTQMLNVCGLQVTSDDTHINFDYIGG